MELIIEDINKTHDINNFNCGLDSVNDFLKNEALKNHSDLLSKTYIARRNSSNNVIAYCTICPHILKKSESEFIINRKYRWNTPAILLAQLGVDVNNKGENLGQKLIGYLFFDVAIPVVKYIHYAAIVVDAENESLISYYQKSGFKRFKEDGLRLYIPMSAILNTYFKKHK